MKLIGLVGGIGPESTIEYYRRFIAAGHSRVIINSVEVSALLGFMQRGDLPPVADYLSAAIDQLSAAGAETGLICANTPHIVFDEVRRRSPIPLVSIVEAAAAKVRSLGLCRVALFGTRYTMEGAFYPAVFAREGLEIVRPQPEDLAFIHDIYLNELLKNIFSDATRDRVLAIAASLQKAQGIEAVILGGTELPLLLRQSEHERVPLLDTTAIHVEAVLGR